MIETKEQREYRRDMFISRAIAHGGDNEDEIIKEAGELWDKSNPTPKEE